MPNILDYLNWRGDLTLDKVPLCEVDSLIFCRLSYIPFDGAVPGEFSGEPVRLGAAAKKVISMLGENGDGRTLLMKDDRRLLAYFAHSARFAGLKLIGYVDIVDKEQEKQFTAITILLPDDSIYIVFRGTGDTLVAWKEDFNMGFCDAVPAQLDATAYVEAAAARFARPMRIGGHSKGGNLALYSASFCGDDVQPLILSVRNFDGPGLNEKAVSADGFQRIIGLTRTYLPQSSVVGMLLEHAEDFSIVHSVSVGLLQHDIYSWEVVRDGFVSVGELKNSSQFVDKTLKNWMENMTPELREKFIDGVFSVLKNSGCETVHDLVNRKKAKIIFREIGKMDEETRAVIFEALGMLRRSARSSLPVLFDRIRIG